MARALWELAWSLRYHPEAVARRGVLVALCAVAQALPAALLHELDLALPELQEWLRGCAEGESDAGCQQLAVACHSAFGGKMRSELASLLPPVD